MIWLNPTREYEEWLLEFIAKNGCVPTKLWVPHTTYWKMVALSQQRLWTPGMVLKFWDIPVYEQ